MYIKKIKSGLEKLRKNIRLWNFKLIELIYFILFYFQRDQIEKFFKKILLNGSQRYVYSHKTLLDNSIQ